MRLLKQRNLHWRNESGFDDVLRLFIDLRECEKPAELFENRFRIVGKVVIHDDLITEVHVREEQEMRLGCLDELNAD